MFTYLLLVFLALLKASQAKVTLISSDVSVCPGGSLVFTCTSDTGLLVWESDGDSFLYHTGHQPASTVRIHIFAVKLTNITGMLFTSTATVHNAQLTHNGSIIACSDSGIVSMSVNKIVQISGPPSPPLNLTVTSSTTFSSVTISWVAPLDTPICVHSYIITVRNSCNSSQVMVYNTTDNRSSLNITNLTSDGEYSATVASRDVAGRLGLESEELIFCFKGRKVNRIPTDYKVFVLNKQVYGIYVRWKYSGFGQTYLITHNISADQSPITVVNRTNVTLYGLQPGETYTVEIIPDHPFYTCNLSYAVLTIGFGLPTSGMNSTKQIEIWMIAVMTVPWALLTVCITCLLVYISVTKVCICKSERHDKTTANNSSQSQQESDSVPKTANTYYEDIVVSSKKDSYTMEDNPSYSMPVL